VKGQNYHEGFYFAYWMVHIIRALLARSSAGSDTLSGCLAFIFTAAADRHHV